MTSLDLGVTAAKRSNQDPLLDLMRQVRSKIPDATQDETVAAWLAALHEHEDYEAFLREAAERYAGNNLWRRTVPQVRQDRTAREREVEKVREVIASNIVLWTMKLVTTGKPLCDSTFAEVAEAAPLTGKFLAKLSVEGAPGALVRDVFKTKTALQAFWVAAQK